MSVRPELYQMEQVLAQRFPALRPAQQRGLALWVVGTILANSACETAVLTALLLYGSWEQLRQRLREWLYDGTEKAAPCRVQLDVTTCFVPLLAWILDWWQGATLVLAIDATLDRDRSAAVVVSVLYRGSAIPVAWAILPANMPGAWMPRIVRLLAQLHPAIPDALDVMVLADRGLWSPHLWDGIRAQGWHPLVRIQDTTTLAPQGRDRLVSRQLVAPGQAWVGRGKLGSPKRRRIAVTLIAVWTREQRDPWVVVTDLPPARVGISWYALRMWIELGFRALKSMGWQWERTRRTNVIRIERAWLVLAVATVWVMAVGTRMEDAAGVGVPPERLRQPPTLGPVRPRRVSVFLLGLRRCQQLVARGRLWTRLWLRPEPLPDPPAGLVVTIHTDP